MRVVVRYRGGRAVNLNPGGERRQEGRCRASSYKLPGRDNQRAGGHFQEDFQRVCVRAGVHARFIPGACMRACVICMQMCVFFFRRASPLCQSRDAALLISAFICITFILRLLSHHVFTGHPVPPQKTPHVGQLRHAVRYHDPTAYGMQFYSIFFSMFSFFYVS